MEEKTYCTIYIARHGQTDQNLQQIIQGHIDSVLNATGESQAKVLGEKLANVHFDAVFASDLLRAKRTAELATRDRNIAIQTTNLLRERSYGDLDGQDAIAFKELSKLFATMTKEEIFTYKHNPGYESDEALVGRFITFVREIAVVYAEKTVLIVSHGGLMRAFLMHIGFGTRKTLPHNSVKNTSYVKFKTDGVDFFVEDTDGIEKVLEM
ncbi:MAG: histidine phosphatase family protein [Candidatus Levyibacteriota bacterium]